MNRCPITYQPCGNQRYTKEGLSLLSKTLTNLRDFPFTAQEQIQLASQLATKLSIQGTQPKLSAILKPSHEMFEVTEKGGTFILKPPHLLYPELPQNEDLTMKLAKIVGITVPIHGMMHTIDGSLTYFIKRFDRLAKNQKIGVEDFSQLLGTSRDTKYDSSMENVALVIEKHCTFPVIEKRKLFKITIFNFLIGNEDMHLKNFSLIKSNEQVELSPSYDLLNTTIVLQSKEETALPIRGKKSKLTKQDLFDYFGHARLGIPKEVLQNALLQFEKAIPQWKALLNHSFLSKKLQIAYENLIDTRWNRLH